VFYILSSRIVEYMKTNKTQAQRYRCFKNGFCPYCGNQDVTMEGTKDGYHAHCRTCKASNHFKDEKIKEWESTQSL
jgi:transcription elongation factor Elf1